MPLSLFFVLLRHSGQGLFFFFSLVKLFCYPPLNFGLR